MYRIEVKNFNPIHFFGCKKLLFFTLRGSGGYALCKQIFISFCSEKLVKILPVDARKQCLLFCPVREHRQCLLCHFKLSVGSSQFLGGIGSLSQNHIGVNAKFFQKIFLNRQVFCVFIIYNNAIQNILRKVPHRGHFISL